MKNKKKVLKLKKGVKKALIIAGLELAICGLLFAYCGRVEAIQNNPNGYTESGHAHTVSVNFNR